MFNPVITEKSNLSSRFNEIEWLGVIIEGNLSSMHQTNDEKSLQSSSNDETIPYYH
jgi:hypothetical protein